MTQRPFAIAGNPNVGKTTLFNSITGFSQHVGNYPGVTIDKVEGTVRYKGGVFTFVDLPGAYSLLAISQDELASRHFLEQATTNGIINIWDASNLKQSLYLTLELVEMELPITVYANMTDVVRSRGISINYDRLSERLGVDIVAGVARLKKGVSALMESVEGKIAVPSSLHYTQEFETTIKQLRAIAGGIPRWQAIKLLEKDKEITERLTTAQREAVKGKIAILEDEWGEKATRKVVRERRAIIDDLFDDCVHVPERKSQFLTRFIDSVVLNKYAALPIFFGFLFLMFQVVFTLGEPMVALLERGNALLASFVASFWSAGSTSILKSLLVDGVIGGVGGVLVFTPNIFLMFAIIAFMEDSGYMSRIAVIMDRQMSRVGLNGKSFIPLILGFGCSVPAIMGARIIESRRERIATQFVVPFMSCGARLPVLLLLVSAFVPAAYRGLALSLIYFIGIVIGLIVALVLRLTLLRGTKTPLLVELPHYNIPSLKSIVIHTWERGKHFLIKAGTVILAVSVILWVLSAFPRYKAPAGSSLPETTAARSQLEHSFIGRLGKMAKPIFAPMGGDWKIGSAFISALAAKEVFVSQMGILLSLDKEDVPETNLRTKLVKHYSLPAALAFIAFILLSAPCMATFAIMKSETKSWRWPLLQVVTMTGIAWVVAVFLYQVGARIVGV